MVAAQVVGNDATITIGGMTGNFELNVMMPVIAYNLLQSIQLLTSAANLLVERCVGGITANRERCLELVERSLAMVTALAPRIGYDAAAAIAMKKAKPGTPEFRSALRDALEGLKNVVGTHGVYNMTPANHNGLDERARVLVQVNNGEWRLVK